MAEKDWCQKFLTLYAKRTGTRFQIERQTEKPDFICSDGNRTIGVEIAEVIGQISPDLNVKKLEDKFHQLERRIERSLLTNEKVASITGSWIYHISSEPRLANGDMNAVALDLARVFFTLPRPCMPTKLGLPPAINWVSIKENPHLGARAVEVHAVPFYIEYANARSFTKRLEEIVSRHSGSFDCLPKCAAGILVLVADFGTGEGGLFEDAARQWECPQVPGLTECYFVRGYNPECQGYELFPTAISKQPPVAEKAQS